MTANEYQHIHHGASDAGSGSAGTERGWNHAAADISGPEYAGDLYSGVTEPDREYCRNTGEYLLAPKYTVGEICTLIFEQTKYEGDIK